MPVSARNLGDIVVSFDHIVQIVWMKNSAVEKQRNRR